MSNKPTYFAPDGGQPPQSAMITSKSVVRGSYAIIPSSSLTNNVCSNLPRWERAQCWVLAAPAMEFGTGFVQYLMFLKQGGGCDDPEEEAGVESFLFVLEGTLTVTVEDRKEELAPGGFAFIPPDSEWSVGNSQKPTAKFLWIRKLYEPFGDKKPGIILNNEQDVPIAINPTSDQKWTTHLIPTDVMSYDMHMNIVSFGPGTTISAIETHIMEHGLYMLQGKGVYLLNEHWHEVEAGDFIWMRPFCPQAFYAGGPSPARYLLYKNVNRQVRLGKTGE